MTEPRARAGAAGFTLVELMISMVILGVVIAFIFAVQTRLTVSFRTQERISSLQEVVESAADMLAEDLRAAGNQMFPGFRTAALGDPAMLLPPVQIINDRDGFGADSVRLAYADTTIMTGVTSLAANNQSATVVDATVFRNGDVVVLSNPGTATLPGGGKVIVFDACLVQITAIAGNTLTFAATAAPFNMANNPQCGAVNAVTGDGQTSAALLVARAYRVDPARLDAAVLQMSPSGELLPNDWTDLGVGFANLQFATRYLEPGDGADVDGDGNAERDWYSSEAQENPDPTGTRPAGGFLKQVSFTVVMRTHDEVSAVGTAESPNLTEVGNPDYNSIGDFDSMPLPGAAAPYRGNHIYRYATDLVNTRNMGTIVP